MTLDVEQIKDIPWKAILAKRKRTKEKKQRLSPEKRKEQIKKWTTFYRRNLDIYAEERLRISLRPLQRIMLHLMGTSQVFFAICSRGLSKTFTVGLFAVIVCLLYPYSEVVITASTLDQGAKMVREKIEKELVLKLSPVLKYLYENGQIKINTGKDSVNVTFFNYSVIKVLPPLDSSRGERATVLIYEECRLLKRKDIHSIFEPMNHPRQAEFLQKVEYAQDTRLHEEGISIYITSARFKSEWFWTTFKQTVVQCYQNRSVNYNFFAGDIFLALKYGLKTKGDWLKIQQTANELDIRMEYLNEMIGEIEDAYFTFALFKANQKLYKAFRPPTTQEFIEGADLKNTPRKPNEFRMLVIDFAFANSLVGEEKNDNTVIECMSGFYNKGRIVRNVDYIETIGGGESDLTIKRIHELFWDYEADYIVLDIRSGGEVMYNDLTKQYDHPERPGDSWNPHGFTTLFDPKLHVVSEKKIEDLRSRTVDPQAIPCIIPIVGTPELNSTMWQTLHATMRDGFIRFLIDDIEYRQSMETKKSFILMDSNERMRIMLPYVQTSFTITEGVNLRQNWNEGKLKLKEPRSGTKDRMVAVSYGNYIFRLLETKLSKQDQKGEFSEEDWSGIIIT